MTINVNKQPYFDDFSKSKNFVSVLFKPSRPVQTRELNQIQSIQHNQLERFADHVFKHGARVSGTAPTRLNTHYVTLDATSPWDGSSLNHNRLVGKRLRGQTSQIEAILLKSVAAIGDDPDTVYVTYTLTAIDQETQVFLNGEIIEVVDKNDIVTYSCKVRCPSCVGSASGRPDLAPTGKGGLWNIPESTYYASGYFIDISPELVVAEKYTTDVESYVVGFDVVMDVVASEDDSSLFDNALGYPNYAADGADRARIRLIPIVRSANFSDGEKFVTLASVVKGIIQYIRSKTDYSTIMEMIAERTYDESGNYTVVPFRVKFFEHLKETATDPNGYFTTAEGGNENLLVGIVSSGKAYVKGYQVERITETMVFLDKARDTKKIRDYYNRITSLNYVLVSLQANSCFSPNSTTGSGVFTNETVDLYDGLVSGGLPTGAVIGKMKIYDVEYDSTVGGIDRYRLYFANISMNATKTYEMVKSMYRTSEVTFSASTVLDSVTNKPKIFNSGSCALLWDIGRSHIKSLHDADNPTVSSMNYTTRRKFFATLDSAGQYTWNAGTDEYFDAANASSTICGVIGDGGAFTKISGTSSQVIITPTQIKVDAGSTHSGKGFLLFHNVMKSGVYEKTKTLVNTVQSDLQLTDGVMTLSKADLFKITSIAKYSTSTPTLKTDVTEHFSWTMGQNDHAYVPVVLTKNASAPLWPQTDRFEVTYTYYEHGTGDFFSVDSYTNIVNDPTLTYGYEDIPSYKATNGVTYDMRSCMDFRPLSITSDSIDTKQAALNGVYSTDIEYYLPRIDMIVINKDGNIFQKKGVSSEAPVPPRIESGNDMAIYQVNMKPFVYDIKKDVTARFIENKRYTMRDIGRLEERISNMEYYTTFTMMEMQAADLSVKDANGFDRFKNGFVVDNFLNYQAADLGSNEFRAALDRKNTELRPSYTMSHTKLGINPATTTNAKILGTVAMIDFDSELWQQQPFASKHISVNPYFIFEKKGKLVLSPDNDSWSDVTREPNLVVDVDTGVDTIERIANDAGLIGTEWGAWGVINTTISSSDIQQPWSSSTTRDWTSSSVTGTWSGITDGGSIIMTTGGTTTTTVGGTQTNTTTTTALDWQRNGIQTTMETRTTSYDLGDRVTDVSIIPYMRSRNVEFHATGMKANTRVYCFFDGADVTSDCRPLATGSQYGSSIVVDSNGNASGMFRIPSGRFFTGQKTFRLTNDEDDSRDPDLLMTSAESVYWAGGVDLSKQSSTMNVMTPMLVDTDVSENRQTSSSVTSAVRSQEWSQTSTAQTWQTETVMPLNPWSTIGDPLAQTFGAAESCFITELDVWFHTVFESDSIFVQIKNTDNGYPGPVILGETRINWDQVNADTSGLTPTRITFPFPVFVEEGKEYALVVGGSSPDTRMWISVLGQEDVTQPGLIIDKQPSLGSLFKSQNNSTWTASQYEDMKFRLYRARFKHTEMTLGLKNDPMYDETMVTNPFETELGSRKVRVHAKTHGAAVGDKTDFRVGEFTWLNVTATIGQLTAEQMIATSTGTAIVKEVKTTQNNTVDCLLSEIKGYFTSGQAFSAQSITPTLNNNYLVTNFTRRPMQLGPSNVVTGTINQDFNIDINGIPIGELNGELTVLAVDSADSFIVETTTAADETGFAGGDVIINSNRRYEMFNVSGSFTAHETEYTWNLAGIGHKCNGMFDSDDYVRREDKLFVPGQDTFVGQPYKVANRLNEIRRLNGDASVKITGNFTTTNTLISPVINADTFSLIGVANRVESLSETAYNVEPNAIGQFIAETDPANGSEIYKYVTRMVTLRNPALDMKIFLDVYKPQDSDFDIYVRTLEPWDSVSIDSKNWVLVEGVWKDFISTSLLEYREVEANLSELMPTVFGSSEFSSFKVKIVGRSKNPANPPMFKKFRAMAVT